MTSQDVAIARVGQAIDAIKKGGMVIMVDDEDRENEGDLVFAAAHVSAEKINFMTKEARGLICLSLDQDSIERLQLPMMEDSSKRVPTKSTAFTVSIEAREGVTTGISAADRAHTIRVATAANATPNDLVVPGHIFPLKARSGGVLQRAGHTEGSIDLVRLAGLPSSAVICEIMNDDGTMARMPDLELFAQRHKIPIVTIADIITYRLQREYLMTQVAKGPVKTAYGEFQSILFKSEIDHLTHVALVKGDLENHVVDVRVHRQRPLLDVLSHPEQGDRSRIEYALRMLQDHSHAVVLYLSHPDPQLAWKADFNNLIKPESQPADVATSQPQRPWTEMDPLQLGVGAQILRHLGVRQMRVHMSRATPLKGLAGFGLEVVSTVQLPSGQA
jgi:3,4-dihydroxy 2-butanone 4-phosphate synthase/GTP cyclohydrolase II